MTLTLLLDLDNTLLGNSMEVFLPAYLKLLSTELAGYARPEALIKVLLSATQQMVENRRPDCTLQEVFEHGFYPVLGQEAADLRVPIERFYTETFPQLEALTQRKEGARALIESAFDRGYRVVIATNPLFPRMAILERLAWAGLPANQYPYHLIGSYETFHFTKPHPAYFAEILGRLGWQEGPAVVVGDDLLNDILPAQILGLPVFWIENAGQPLPPGGQPPSASGQLEDVLPWLDQIESQAAEKTPPSAAGAGAVLLSTPAVIDHLCRRMSDEAWQTRLEPDQWSPTEILCHLRDVDREVNLPRLQKVLAEENPFLPGQDTDRWAEERNYFHQNGPLACVQFFSARMQILNRMDPLKPEDWRRKARHAILGPTTLSEMVGIMAAHDRLHIQQFLQTIEIQG